MNIPKYLENKVSVIILKDKEIINNSRYEILDNTLFIKSLDNVYLYFGDYINKTINIDIQENADIQLYIILKSSKNIDYEINLNIHNNAKIDVFTEIRNIDLVNIRIKRVFNISKKATLNLNNALLNKGNTYIADEINLNEEYANVFIDQLNIGSFNDNFKIIQDIKHNAKLTTSIINNSLISNSNSKLEYSVSGHIFKGNELSSCKQMNKGIILNEFGIIEVEPKLYIDEYNVEASHGAAIGQIDEEQLYYLLSRGLTETEARSLIISGYTKPFIRKIQDEDIRLLIERQILKKINKEGLI